MGDVVSLVEKAAAHIDAEKAARIAERMRKGQFDLNDMREQLMQMANMGGISGLMGMMPGIAKMKNQIANAGLDDRILKRQVAVIDSMTRQERKNPDVLKASRKKRIAAGSGPEGRGSQQAAQNAPQHGRHDEGHGIGQARPDGRHRAGDGLWRRHAFAGADEGARRKNAGRRQRRHARAAEGFAGRFALGPAESARAYRTSAASRPCRGSAAFPVWERRNEEFVIASQQSANAPDAVRRIQNCTENWIASSLRSPQ